MNFSSGKELKKARTSVTKSLNLKIMGVRGNSTKVYIKAVSSGTIIISACFIGPGCSVVAL